MIDLQRKSEGIELIIDTLTEYTQFQKVEAEFLSPSGAITTITTQKFGHTKASVFINAELIENGVHEIQLVGYTATGKAFSEVGKININKNLGDL